MPDMLVPLLKLPPLEESLDAMKQAGVVLRRAQTFEMTPVRRFVEANWSASWADEISAGYSNKPVTIYIALRDGRLVGFGAFECTRRGFFGPTGVLESERSKGIGKA